MMDIREKLVELLREVQYLGGLEEKITDHLIRHGVTVQEWIPVSEPPKESGRYYVYISSSYVDVVSFYKKSIGRLHENVWCRYDDDVGFYEVSQVTHWMPLPQPPKGE